MANKARTDFNYSPLMQNFYSEIAKTLVQQEDYKGMSGHGPSTHGGTHPLHSQTSIGMVGRTVNMRMSS